MPKYYCQNIIASDYGEEKKTWKKDNNLDNNVGRIGERMQCLKVQRLKCNFIYKFSIFVQQILSIYEILWAYYSKNRKAIPIALAFSC